jgi:hypothetical protein
MMATSRRTSTPALELLLPPSTKLAFTPPPSSYDIASLSALIARIATYRLTSYLSSPPPSLTPLSLALSGWINKGPLRNRVECVTCHAGVILVTPEGGWNNRVGIKLREKYEKILCSGIGNGSGQEEEGGGHKGGCAWTIKPWRRTLYRVGAASGDSRNKVIADLIERATSIGEWRIALDDISQFIPAVKYDRFRDVIKAKGDVNYSRENLLLALFGWSIISPPTSSSTTSLHKATSDNLLLHCHLCTRQVLLSPYLSQDSTTTSPKRLFNLQNQHQSFCTYIDSTALLRSSSSTSLNSVRSIDTARAGWEKILEVILGRIDDHDESGLKKTVSLSLLNS